MRVPKRVVVAALAVFGLVLCLQPKAVTAQDFCPVCPTDCCGSPVYDSNTGQCVCPLPPPCPCGAAYCSLNAWLCSSASCSEGLELVCNYGEWVCEGGGGCDPNDCSCNPSSCNDCDICDP